MKLKAGVTIKSEIKLWYTFQQCRYRGLLALERISRQEEKELDSEQEKRKPFPTPEKKFSYRTQCRDKTRHLTKRVASDMANNLKQSSGQRFNVYLCGYCNYWHVGKEIIKPKGLL